MCVMRLCQLLIVLFIFFFFFKQKTAYEMRISDWSSDVCSSDLNEEANRQLIAWLEAGGVRSLMYGGNANFYNLPISEYAEVLEFLCSAVGPDTWLIPSFGPDYGRLIDQAKILRGTREIGRAHV